MVETGTHPSETTEVIESSNFINSDATVELSANIIYDAANCVELLPDFETELGSEFEAIIEGCGGAVTLKNSTETEK